MKILMLCGYFAKNNEAEVVSHARSTVQFSANLFQQKLINGFRSLGVELCVLSAPFIGSYPNESDIFAFEGFKDAQNECQYVHFNNTWGLRNISRAAALKKAIRFFINDPCKDKLIVVYCPHTPFLEAAVYAKRRDPRIRCCLYVPDLPEYMNLAEKRSLVYDIAKKYDIAVMTRLMEYMDSFVLLTEHMKDLLPVGNKPYMVCEGIVEKIPITIPHGGNNAEKKYVVYTGKMNTRFGIRDLIDSFEYLSDPSYRLILCGRGDCDTYAISAAKKDPRIQPLGQVLPREAAAWQSKAAVLVNPRGGQEAYTRYSFPSKNLEYLLTGKPVVAHRLEGMPTIYSDLLYEIQEGSDHVKAIADAIFAAISDSSEKKAEKHNRFIQYAKDHLLASQVAEAVLKMMGGDKG